MTERTNHTNGGRVLPRVMAAATGLAADLFPIDGDGISWTTTREHVLFMLDGHISEWSGWSDTGIAAGRRRLRCALLLKRRLNDLANAETAGTTLDRLLLDGKISGCRAGDDYKAGASGKIVVDAGMSLADFIDTALDDLDTLHANRKQALPPAMPGTHTTSIRVPGPEGTADRYVDFRFDIQPHHRDPAQPPPTVIDSPPLDDLWVPFKELAQIAELLDGCPDIPGDHRTGAVRKFEKCVRSREADQVKGLDLTAGRLNALLAYTGFGKSVVLVEVLACWAVRQQHVIAFVLPTNADVVKVTHQIERAVEAVGLTGEIVALTSPRSRIHVATEASSRVSGTGPDIDWIWDRFGYGCALSAVATSDGAVDGWIPGREPCATLRSHVPKAKARAVACPWRTTCGRFQASRAACTADVIVTTHGNLLLGVLQTPVYDGYVVNDRLSVEELVLRRCQVVVIDEVDSFQRTAIDQAGRGLVLDQAGHTRTPLRALDEDFGAAFGKLLDEVDANVRDAYFNLRYLSENYVSHLSYERLGPARRSKKPRKPGPGRAWIVPRHRDNWLAARLFNVNPDDQVSEDQMRAFLSLFSGSASSAPNEPDGYPEARRQIELAVRTGAAGTAIPQARHVLGHLVPSLSETERREFVDEVLRRAILEHIRGSLHRLMANNSQLVDIGVESAQAVADALGTYGRWRATPTGPLGRLVFAFTEYYDGAGTEPARLTTTAFGGDPHTHIVSLGDVTALAHARTRRIVLGLSATSYFPLAPHHHVHTQPRWWVRDDSSGTVTIAPAVIVDHEGNPSRISGVQGTARAEATRRIAGLLWTRHLAQEFRRLASEDEERQRVLLATTSYVAGRHVAEGLVAAGVEGRRICLAVPPGAKPSDQQLWRELAADQLELFSSLSGTDILIAPLARVQRGVNIIGKNSKSALGSVWLIVRPIPVIDEPAELVAHIQARALAEHPGPVLDPRALLKERRKEAGRFLEEIVRCPPYFQSQPKPVKLGVAAEIIIGAIQLIGRARRGGTSATLHLVDGAFHDGDRGTDLSTLIAKLVKEWRPEQLRDMREYYGSTLDAFLDYAAKAEDGAARC
ncbi:hypothetical protein [Crossiella sp. NPDC003009]